MQIRHLMTISNSRQFEIADIQDWLVNQFADRLEIDPEDIDIHEPFDNYDLNSVETIVLLKKLEKWLECNLNPTLIFNYPNIAELAKRLAEETSVTRQKTEGKKAGLS
jgi:acyl carrier protein